MSPQVSSIKDQSQSQVSAFLRITENAHKEAVKVQTPVTSKNLNTEQQVKAVIQPVISQMPKLSDVAASLAKISETSSNVRQLDKSSSTGLLTGATTFGSNVADIYKFLVTVGPSISGPDSGTKLLSLASQYSIAKGNQLMLAQAGQQPADKAKNTADSQLKLFDDLLGDAGSKIFGAVGAAYSVYELTKGTSDPISGAVQGAATGAYLGSYLGVPAVGAIVGGIAGAVSGLFKKSGKPIEQKERDIIRKHLQAAGILDADWNIKLANGASFDMGKDGGAKLQNLDGSERHFKEFDLTNPLTEPAAKLLAPLAQQITGGHPRLTAEFTAYLTNAVNSNAASIEDSIKNVQVIYAQFGLSFEDIIKQKIAA